MAHKAEDHLNSPRIRFNWAYWDAMADVRNNRPANGHYLRTAGVIAKALNISTAAAAATKEGYSLGRRDGRERVQTDTSEAAWTEYQASLVPNAARIEWQNAKSVRC